MLLKNTTIILFSPFLLFQSLYAQTEYISLLEQVPLYWIIILGIILSFAGIYISNILITKRVLLRTKELETSLQKNYEKDLALATEKTDQAMKRFNTAMLATEDGIWDWDIVTNEVYYSPAWQTMLGYEVGDLEQNVDAWLAILHPDDLQPTIDHAQRFIHNESNEYRMEFRMLCKDGSYKWVLARAKDAERDEKGTVTRIIGTHLDIQERKTYERELELAKEQTDKAMERFNTSMLATEDGIWDWNTVTNEVYFSPAWQTMLGYEVGDLEQNVDAWLAILHPDDLQPTIDHAQRFIHNESNEYRMEFRMLCKDGSYKWVLARAKDAERDDKGVVTRIIGTHVDMQKTKKLELELIEAKEVAEYASLAKSEFLSNMSHEIRTPMNAIIGFAEILAKAELPSKAKRQVKTIQKSSEALIAIINDILDLSKIEAGKMEIQPITLNIFSLITDTKMIFSEKISEKGLEFIIDIDPLLPTTVILDEVRIRQVLFNLVSNSIKFTHDGSITIQIKQRFADADESYVDLTISVKDTGIGISKDDQLNIFNAFEQQKGQSTKKYGGTGLGLAISKRLIDLMNGTIKIESIVGNGSEFNIDLNNVPIGGLTNHDKFDKTKEVFNFEKATLLVADDVDNNIVVIKDYFANSKLEIIEAINGEKAIEMVELYNPDAILMDLQMPVMDGKEAAIILKKTSNTMNIPIIAFSATIIPDESRIVDGLVIFDNVLQKPVNFHALESTLSEYLPHTKETVMSTVDKDYNTTKVTLLDEEFLEKYFDTIMPLLEVSMQSGNLNDTLTLIKLILSVEEPTSITSVFTQKLEENVNDFELISVENILKLLHDKMSLIIERKE